MIVLIQVISEAARFDPIEELFRNTFTTGKAVKPPGHILDLENSWQPMSEIGTRHVVDPNDERIHALMLAHRPTLAALGIEDDEAAKVVTAVLAIALFIFIPS